jgi:RNA polymerase sigma-70 factor (ECF subfamily)
MRRIATHVAVDALKRRRKRREEEIADDRLAAPPAADPHVANAIARAVASLPPKLHVVAMLALVEEQPYAEIADALGVPIGTVKSRVFRATRALREQLTRAGVRPR